MVRTRADASASAGRRRQFIQIIYTTFSTFGKDVAYRTGTKTIDSNYKRD